ncbi:hypothetical protein B1A_08786 [mine drainage metagenome]|uniref:Amidohydrolase n=1 Tax=mine drainage metagenome TaxID=410659 RepID=T1B3Y1_9ZZZZ
MSRPDHSILLEAQALAPELTAWRRHLHENPELSFEEFETTDFLEKTLREWASSR